MIVLIVSIILCAISCAVLGIFLYKAIGQVERLIGHIQTLNTGLRRVESRINRLEDNVPKSV